MIGTSSELGKSLVSKFSIDLSRLAFSFFCRSKVNISDSSIVYMLYICR